MKSRAELVADRTDMRTWDILTLAIRFAEASFMAGSLFDWAQYKLEDRDRYVLHMAFAEDALEELEARLQE